MTPRTLGTLFAAGVLLPSLGQLAWSNTALILKYPETAYYRYISSLRWLYSPNPSYALPQGQPLGALQNGINILLTALNYAPFDQDEFIPRITLFCLVSVAAMTAILLASTNILLTRTLTNFDALLVSTIILIPLFGTGSFGFFEFSKPDYEPLTLVVFVLAAAACVAIVERRSQLSRSSLLWIGALCGASVTLKVTLVVLPFTILLLMLLYAPTKRRYPYMLATVCLSAIPTASLIWYLQYLSPELALEAGIGVYHQAFSFSTYSADRPSFLTMALRYLDPAANLSFAERLIMFVPGVLVLLQLISRRRLRLWICLVPITIYYYAYLRQRWAASTYFEFFSFTVFLLCLTLLTAPSSRWRMSRWLTRSYFGLAGLSLLSVAVLAAFLNNVHANIVASDSDQFGTNVVWNSWAIFKSIPGRQLFLFEADPSPRPHLFAGDNKIENLMIGISAEELGDGRAQRRDFVHAFQSERTPTAQNYDSVVFYYPGSMEELVAQRQSIWDSMRKGYPFLNLESFQPSLVYPVRSGPHTYIGPGVYVTYARTQRS